MATWSVESRSAAIGMSSGELEKRAEFGFRISAQSRQETLDIAPGIVHLLCQGMKKLSFLAPRPSPPGGGSEDAIRVYRRHAARAISEERWPAAEIFFDRILELVPGHTESWLMKGWLREHCHHDQDTAVACYRKVISLCGYDGEHPHVQRARRSLGRLLATLG